MRRLDYTELRTVQVDLFELALPEAPAYLLELVAAEAEAETVRTLPERPTAEPGLHDLLVRARLNH